LLKVNPKPRQEEWSPIFSASELKSWNYIPFILRC
jgi:hypothetical protein